MSLLEKLFSNESFKKSIFTRMAKQAKEAGIKKLLITINEDGNFDVETLEDSKIIIAKQTFDFLKNHYEQNKHRPGSNYPDIIKKS